MNGEPVIKTLRALCLIQRVVFWTKCVFEQVGPGAIVVVVFGFRRFWTFGVLDRLVGPYWDRVLTLPFSRSNFGEKGNSVPF